MTFIIVLLALFGIKHFLADFVLQSNRMISEKGTYGAPGGLEHAGWHAILTTAILFCLFPWDMGAHAFAILLGGLDGVIHYHIDWAKTNLSRGLTPADRKFWLWLGADQGLHYLTYILIIGIIVL